MPEDPEEREKGFGRLRRLSLQQGVKNLTINVGPRSGTTTESSGPRRKISVVKSDHAYTPMTAGTSGSVDRYNETEPSSLRSRRLSTVQLSDRSLQMRRTSQSTPTQPMMRKRTGISILGIFAAKKISRKLLAALSEIRNPERTFGAFRKISTLSSSSYSFRSLRPSYQLGPEYPFCPQEIRFRVEEYFKRRVETFCPKYNPIRASQLCCSLVNEIKFILRGSGADRYRYVVFCVVLQNANQTVQLASRTLWNLDTDRSISVEYHTQTMHIICTAFAIYKE